jgi:galactokinase
LVISAAINKFVHIASTPRTDGKVELVSAACPERETFRIDEARSSPAALWSSGVKRVLGQLGGLGLGFRGFNAAIWDDLPPGMDLGGSTVLEVAAALTLRRLYPFSLSESGLAPPPKRDAKGEVPPLRAREKLWFARLWHSADADDPQAARQWCEAICSLCGKAWHVLNIDLRFRTVEQAPMIGEAIVVCVVQGPGGEVTAPAISIEELGSNSESALAKLGAKSLRSVELSLLKAARSKLTSREYEYAAHTVGEIARVVAAERALRDDDHRQFGQFMFQSQESWRTLLDNSSPQVDALIDLARAQAGCLGARQCAGAAAATVNLVSYHHAERFMKRMAQEYDARTGNKLTTFLCQMVDGAA